MTMTPSDRILSAPRGDAAQAIAQARAKGAKRIAEVERFINEVFRLAPLVAIDPSIPVSQSAEETGWWTSQAWITRLNPAGLGITDGTNFGYSWENGTDAARAQIVHLYEYADGDPPAAQEPMLAQFAHLDPRLGAIPDAWVGSVETIGELTGKWATDPRYGEKIAAFGNAIWPDLPDQGGETPVPTLTFGNVPHPPFVGRLIPDIQNSAWDNLGQRVPVGVCQHTMVGSLNGTDGWFRRGRNSTGLTDYGIGGSTDGRLDGVIYRWNDPLGRATTVELDGERYTVSANRSGWANGGSDGLEGDGPLYVRTFGVGGINRNLVSIERSDGGNIATPMSPKQFESICQLTAYWFDWAKVPWDRYPLNPAHGCVTHMIHKEFATKDCPHPAVYHKIDAIQDRVRAILKAAQTQQPAPEPIPPPNPPNPDHNDWAPYTLGQVAARFADLRQWHVPAQTNDPVKLLFDPKGLISNAWFQRIKQEGVALDAAPVPDEWSAMDTEFIQPIDTVVFGGGAWVLVNFGGNEGFKWVR